MKNFKSYTTTIALASVMMLVGCSENNTQARKNLDDTLLVANNTLDQINKSTDQIKEAEIANVFAKNFEYNMNITQPEIYPYPIGVEPKDNGSFEGYKDANSNGIKEIGENKVFGLEIDTQGQRLLASADGTTADRGFNGSGLLMGMFLGNMLSRQRAAGVSPSRMRAKTASPKPSARSRSGSGSFSRGK